MKILQKIGDSIDIIALPHEAELEKGSYLLASQGDKSLLLQVIDVSYANIPGMIEDMLRNISSESLEFRFTYDPLDAESYAMMVRECRMIRTKIRLLIDNGKIVKGLSWLPSRYNSKIEKVSADKLMEIMGTRFKRCVDIGYMGEERFFLNVEGFDGRLTIITGKKETGKSHVAKLIATSLAENGCYVIILDVNGEYVNLNKKLNGSPSNIADKFLVLEPGKNFRTTLTDAGIKTIIDILEHVYSTPSNSLRELVRAWHLLERSKDRISLRSLLDIIVRMDIHESVKEALTSRLSALQSNGFFTNEDRSCPLEDVINSYDNGLLLVINMKDLIPVTRKVVVEYLLSKLESLLKDDIIQPIFLIAEEAHLYLRETYWDDVVTRMRHLGLYPIFVTNQPDTIPATVYRQADNIFLFNFTNEFDLESISRSSRIDVETCKQIAGQLPPKHCLIFGTIVSDLPVVIRVKDTDNQTMGRSKLFFYANAVKTLNINY